MSAEGSLLDAEDLFILGALKLPKESSSVRKVKTKDDFWDEWGDEEDEDDDRLYPRDGTIPWVYPVREKRT